MPISEYFIFLKYLSCRRAKFWLILDSIIIMGYLLSPTQHQRGTQTYCLAKFPRKLHENENWTQRVHPKLYYVNPPLLQARRIVGLTHTESGLSLMDLLYINA